MTRALFFASLLAWPGAAAAQEPGDGFQVERYDVDLRPDLDSGRISGRQEILIEATADGVQRIAFSPNALAIEDARSDDAAIGVTMGAEGIAFTLPAPLARGERATLRFTFHGTPARGLTRTPAGIATGYFACDWMVCLQDAPGDKAELTLDLYVPEGLTTLGVGTKAETLALDDGLALHRWRSERPTSPFLFAFALGEFRSSRAESAQGTLTFLDATGENADLPALFAQTAPMAAFFAERAGVPLPGGEYSQLLMPGRAAQETMSWSLIGKAWLDAEAEDPDGAWVIAHELAHQWWGNLVTCDTWRDFWLNEGFATFMVAAWKEHAYGAEAYEAELAIFRRRHAQLIESGWDKPLTWQGAYPSLGTRRAVQYSKSALFLATLREHLGDEVFWRGVRNYTRKHAGGTVTSKDFQRAMEEASGREMARLFDEWVFGDGLATGGS